MKITKNIVTCCCGKNYTFNEYIPFRVECLGCNSYLYTQIAFQLSKINKGIKCGDWIKVPKILLVNS